MVRPGYYDVCGQYLRGQEANFIVSADDLRHFGREEDAVAAPNGSGYIATMSVYHELHCIVRATPEILMEHVSDE